MALADYLDVAVLNHFFRGVSTPAPAAVFVGLFIGDPDAGGTEVAAEGYERREVAFGEPEKVAGDVYGIANSVDVEFPRAREAWGRVSHFVVFDGRTDGNALRGGALRQVKAVEADDVIELRKGDLRIQYRKGNGA